MTKKSPATRGRIDKPCGDDHNIVPVGVPAHPLRPLAGLNARDYYQQKHRNGEFGKYFGLHHAEMHAPARWSA